MEVGKARLGRLPSRIESEEWVERRPDRVDRRIKRGYLTDRVQGLMRSLRTIAAEIRNDATVGIDRDRHEAFIDTLLQIKANLQAFDELRGPVPDAQHEAADD